MVGHSQNEGDAMHALIEKKKSFLRGDKLYLPSQLSTIISMAKQTHPRYKINQMCYSDFIDLKDLQSNTGRNFDVNTEGGKVLWSDICMIMYKKSTPTIIYYKTSSTDIDFCKIDVRYKTRGSQVPVV